MNLEANLLDSSSRTKQGAELVSIQYLRGLAALGVVLCHASISLLDKEQSLIPLGAGSAGVDLFFVISGFIMFYTTANRAMDTGEFYLRRFVRIFPLYFAASSVAFLIAKVAPFATRTFSANPYDYIRSILFIPYYSTTIHLANSSIPLMRPEVGQGWTLNYEVFFYFVFGLSLYLPRRYRMPSVATFLLVLTATGVLFRPSGAITSTYTDSLLLEFVLGIVLGYVLVRKLRTSMEAAALLSVMLAGVLSLGIEVFTTSPLPRVIEYGLPAAGLVAGALYLERAKRMPNVPALLILGDASYSLYLLHGFLLAVLRRVWQRYFDINLVSTHVMFILVSTIAAGAVGIAAFRYVERPVTRRLTKALRKKGLLRDDGMRKETQLTSEPRQTVHAI